jgi:hypothetical protein
MRIVLQNCDTSLFVLSAEDWTEDKEAARGFDNSAEASSFIRARGLQNMQVVYEFDEPPYHTTIPSPPETAGRRTATPPEKTAARRPTESCFRVRRAEMFKSSCACTDNSTRATGATNSVGHR